MNDIQIARNNTIDIGKGIAIILMCIGHAYCPIILKDFIYMFHMAFFFIVSGYFISNNNLINPKRFIWNKTKRLWLPFVKWGLAFVLLHNFFLDLKLLTTENKLYTIKDFIWKGLTTIPRFIPTEDMMGSYWFLSCLFYTSAISLGLFTLGRLFKQYQDSATGMLFILAYLAGYTFVYLDELYGQIRIALVAINALLFRLPLEEIQ